MPPTPSLSISNFPPSSSRLSSPLVTSLITSFHHSVRFGDLAKVNVVMMTLIYSNVDSDDENNNENDGNDGDGDEFLSAWTRHGQNWSQICWATYQRPVLQPIFNRQPYSPAVARRCYPWLVPDEYAISFCQVAKPRSCPASPSPVTGMVSGVGYNVVVVTGSTKSEG